MNSKVHQQHKEVRRFCFYYFVLPARLYASFPRNTTLNQNFTPTVQLLCFNLILPIKTLSLNKVTCWGSGNQDITKWMLVTQFSPWHLTRCCHLSIILPWCAEENISFDFSQALQLQVCHPPSMSLCPCIGNGIIWFLWVFSDIMNVKCLAHRSYLIDVHSAFIDTALKCWI